MKKRDFLLMGLITATAIILIGSFIGASMDNYNIKDAKAAQVEKFPKDVLEAVVDEVVEDKVPDTFTGLLIGTDVSESLTDVIMVGRIDTVRNKIDVISVPRDLVIDFREDYFKEIKENNPDNHILYCKLNEVYNLTGQNDRSMKDLQEIVSIITGLKIDQVAIINVDGFSDLVDVIGGVEFNVPERMYYPDPMQDLYIDLQPGMQLLDGDKAEQLVRYRHYVEGDLKRIQVQQEFMIALFNKVKNIDNFSQVKQLVTTGYKTYTADFGLLFALDYVEYFFDLDILNILSTKQMVTIPSYGDKVDGIWYQTWDLDEAHKVVNELIYP